MRKKIFNILLFIIALVAVGCTKDGSGAPKAFKNQTDICLMSDGNVIMSYDAQLQSEAWDVQGRQ